MINFVRRSSNKSNPSESINSNCSNVTTGGSGSSCITDSKVSNSTKVNVRLVDLDPEVRLEEKLRKKAFAHYDVQSICGSLNGSKGVISKRKNTTTGASAASFLPSKQSISLGSKDINGSCTESHDQLLILDDGDGRSNDLLQSCPFFRNELGGEEERIICLNRVTAGQAGGQSVYSGSTSIGSTGSGASSSGLGTSSNNGAIGSSSGQPSPGGDRTNQTTVPPLLHKPSMATGLSLLESANERRWKLKGCPYQSSKSLNGPSSDSADRYQMYQSTNDPSFVIEHVDTGARYYREHFHGLEHQNWFGMDDNLGPIAISIRKERVPNLKTERVALIPGDNQSRSQSLNYSGTNYHANGKGNLALMNGGTISKSTESRIDRDGKGSDKQGSDKQSSDKQSSDTSTVIKHQYRVIIRTSDLNVLRGIVYEDVVPGLVSLNGSSSSKHNSINNHHAKEIIEYITPEITSNCLRLGTPSSDEQVIKLDEQSLNKTFKVGVLYCKYGQGTEEEMYNNEYSSRAFDDFLLMLGEKVHRDFPHFFPDFSLIFPHFPPIFPKIFSDFSLN